MANHTYVVSSPFRDLRNYDKEFIIGEDVSHLDDERLLSLLDKGLVEQLQSNSNSLDDEAKKLAKEQKEAEEKAKKEAEKANKEAEKAAKAAAKEAEKLAKQQTPEQANGNQ